jgi:hypothetical protein
MRSVRPYSRVLGVGILVAGTAHACAGFEAQPTQAVPTDAGVDSSTVNADDSGGLADADARGPLRVFVTPGVYVGSSFGPGAPLADYKCKDEAAGSGDWRAFLKAGGKTPGERMNDAGPWVHPKTGRVVFANALALDGPGTLATIDWDVNGNALEVTPNVDVWTGANGSTCGDWDTPAEVGGVGRLDGTNYTWRANDVRGCTASAHLYCLER